MPSCYYHEIFVAKFVKFPAEFCFLRLMPFSIRASQLTIFLRVASQASVFTKWGGRFKKLEVTASFNILTSARCSTEITSHALDLCIYKFEAHFSLRQNGWHDVIWACRLNIFHMIWLLSTASHQEALHKGHNCWADFTKRRFCFKNLFLIKEVNNCLLQEM